MNTRHINTRLALSSALAAGIFLAAAPMQAQAPAPSIDQSSQAKIASLQAQVDELQARANALQAQVKRLQAQVRASSPSPVTGLANPMPLPKFTIPKFTVPNMTLPNNQQIFIVPHTQSRNGSIPDYTATFIRQPAH